MEYDGFMTTIQQNRTQKRTVLVFSSKRHCLVAAGLEHAGYVPKKRASIPPSPVVHQCGY